MAFTRSLTVTKEEKHKKDVRVLDGDRTVYGIFREDKGNIAHIVKFDNSGIETPLADIQWIKDRQDKVRFPGGEWQKVNEAWPHYNVVRDSEPYLSWFTGSDGQKYIWHLRGSMKILSVGAKDGPIVAKHVESGRGGALELTDTASRAGEMLFITFLAAEGVRGRVRISWTTGFFGMGASSW